MIADDIHNIREGMRKLAQAKVQAEAETARRAEADAKPADLPTPKPLFSESAPPFRGFFVTEDGDIRPFDMPDDQAAIFGTPPGGTTTVKAFMGGYDITHDRAPNAPEDWEDWIDTQEGNIVPPGATDPIQFTFTVNDCPTEPQSAAIERLAAEYRRRGIDPWDEKEATVQAANRFSFWGFAGEDPDGA